MSVGAKCRGLGGVYFPPLRSVPLSGVRVPSANTANTVTATTNTDAVAAATLQFLCQLRIRVHDFVFCVCVCYYAGSV